MGRFKFRLVDKNRMVKTYPFIRTPKRTALQSQTDAAIEIGQLMFNNEEKKTFIFQESFDNTNYAVVAVPRQSTTADSANVNIYVVNDETTKSQVTIGASAPFTGIVDLFAIVTTS